MEQYMVPPDDDYAEENATHDDTSQYSQTQRDQMAPNSFSQQNQKPGILRHRSTQTEPCEIIRPLSKKGTESASQYRIVSEEEQYKAIRAKEELNET